MTCWMKSICTNQYQEKLRSPQRSPSGARPARPRSIRSTRGEGAAKAISAQGPTLRLRRQSDESKARLGIREGIAGDLAQPAGLVEEDLKALLKTSLRMFLKMAMRITWEVPMQRCQERVMKTQGEMMMKME